MKYFRLAGAGYRDNIDLTIYRTDIDNALKIVKPGAVADVHRSYFTTSPELRKRESIALSAILRKKSMEELTTYRSCLFISSPDLTRKETEEQNVSGISTNGNPGKKAMGGRCRNTGKVPANQQKSNKKARKGES